MQSKSLLLGNIVGTIYDFPEIGDCLERHTHTETDVHITLITKGTILVKADKWEKQFSAGAILDWKPYEYHSFVGVEPNSRIVNIVKA